MTEASKWSEQDRVWTDRYRNVLSQMDVPADARQERVNELRLAVAEAGVSAYELFGDAGALAAEDAAELATPDEAVRRSLGGGLRPVLREVGNTLVGIGVVSVLTIVIRGGWFVDIDIAHLLVAGAVLIAFLGWIFGRAMLSAGRWTPGIGTLGAACAACAAGITAAADLGPGHLAAAGVPVLLLSAAILAPGVVLLIIASRLQQPGLREHWTNDRWLRRLGGGLRARLVPAAATREHVAEITQLLGSGTAAFAEFGHPLVLAREIAAGNRIARARHCCCPSPLARAHHW